MNFKYEKQDFILNYLKKYGSVNILDKFFVDNYIAKFKVKYTVQYFGANTCRDLGRVLSEMYKCNLLTRFRIGMDEAAPGFPNWIYVYRLKHD